MKLRIIAVLLSLFVLAGCTDDKKPKPQQEDESVVSSEPQKNSSESNNKKDVGDMTLNEIANEIENIPPEKWEELTSSLEEEWTKEAEEQQKSASSAEWEFFDPFKTEYEEFEWNEDYDPLEGYETPSMPDLPQSPQVPEGDFSDPFTR